MFDPEAFLPDPSIDREQLERAIERIRDDALMLHTAHAREALVFIESELETVRWLITK